MKLTETVRKILKEDAFMDKVRVLYHTKLWDKLPNTKLEDFDEDALRLGVVTELQAQEENKNIELAIYKAMRRLRCDPHCYDDAGDVSGEVTDYAPLIGRSAVTSYLGRYP
jgi:hypothetical protein